MTRPFEDIVEVALVADAHQCAGDVWQLVGESCSAMLLFAVSSSEGEIPYVGSDFRTMQLWLHPLMSMHISKPEKL